MLPASAAVLWTAALMGLVSLVGFVWAWSIGHFTDTQAQAWSILDPDDLQYDRPWETATQRQDRIAAFGPPLTPPPGAWGGGAS